MQRNAYGLDISDRSAELVSLFHKGGVVSVSGYGRTEIPPGVIHRGIIMDPDRLAKVLSGFLDGVFGQKRGRIPVAFALPEHLVYSRPFPLPGNFERDLAVKALAIEAAEMFPISMNDVVSDMWVVSRGKESQDVMFAAAERRLAEAYRSLLVRVGAQPVFFDAESVALARGLVDFAAKEPVLVVDVGAQTTMLVLCDKGAVRMSSSIPTGGDDLSAAIEQTLKIPLEKAETMKRRAGFDPSAEDGRLFLILQRPMAVIIDEIRLTAEYYERTSGRKVKKIVLAGGTSLTPSIAEYVESGFAGATVSVGNPLTGLSLGRLTDSGTFKKRAILYATALGLAKRAIGMAPGPWINLLPGAQGKKGGIADLMASVRGVGQFIRAMLSKGKKPKKKVQRKEEPAEETPVAAEAPAEERPVEPAESPPPEAASAPAPEPAPAKDAPSDPLAGLSIAAKEEPPQQPPAAAPTEVTAADVSAEEASEASDTTDYGKGIGEFLGSGYERGEEETAEEVPDSGEPVMPTKHNKDRMKIEHILKRARGEDVEAPAEAEETPDAPDQVVEDDDEDYTRAIPAESATGSGGRRPVVLITLLGIVLLVAAAGIFMFAKRSGFSGLFGAKKPAATVDAPAGSTEKGVPESVNVVFIASTEGAKEGEMPVLAARVVETEASASDSFKATGTAQTGTGRAKGTLTVVNTTSRTYTFVATTRFLTPEGVLFRLDKATTFPANAETPAIVTADKPGPASDIGPSTFTIPGLGDSMKEIVYAKSDSPMAGGGGTTASVSAEDIAKAKAALEDKLKGEAQKDVSAMIAEGEAMLVDLLTSKEVSMKAPTAGTAAASFTATLTSKFYALMVPEKDVRPLLEEKLKASLPAGTSSNGYTLGEIVYTVEAYDAMKQQAEIRAAAPVKVK